MYKPKLVLITMAEMTRLTPTKQLSEIFKESLNIQSYALDLEGTELEEIYADMVLVSSPSILEEIDLTSRCDCPVVVSKRVPNFNRVDEIIMLPVGATVGVVNDHSETIQDLINSLLDLKIDHVTYRPLLPQSGQTLANYDAVVTPGESHLISSPTQQIIDIGVRLIDLDTITKIMVSMRLTPEETASISQRYMNQIIELARRVATTTQRVSTLNRHLAELVNNLHEGVLAVDHNGIVQISNEHAESLLGIPSAFMKGKFIGQVPLTPEMKSFFISDGLEESKTFRLRGRDIVVTKMPRHNGNLFILKVQEPLKSRERKQQREMLQNGYIAKYTFDHVIGDSSSIQRTKQIARKLAATDLPILLFGESGTGKELFASAIHNGSDRSTGPYLAVNFSALSEELVESELFGYAEGAFTGAKKGGKAGFFGLAEKGTLFLDEIGDISTKIQTRLLRVLDSKEFLRVGGNKIRYTNVRIVAATNKNLFELVQQGKFRLDLYHRLRTLYLEVPPLRERTGDVIKLLQHFLLRNTPGNAPQVADKVIDWFENQQWYGNVRELKNMVDYVLAIQEDPSRITFHDLPQLDTVFGTYPTDVSRAALHNPTSDNLVYKMPLQPERATLDDQVHKALCHCIFCLKQKGLSTGRATLSTCIPAYGYNLSEQQIRRHLRTMKEEGLILITRGRTGVALTTKGRKWLDTE